MQTADWSCERGAVWLVKRRGFCYHAIKNTKKGLDPGSSPGTVASLHEDAWHYQQSNHYATKAVYDSLTVGSCKKVYKRGYLAKLDSKNRGKSNGSSKTQLSEARHRTLVCVCV